MREIALHILDLVQNAVAAGASTITIDIVEDHPGDILRLVVTDNGCGMDEAFCQQVTDPFVTSRRTRNVGLGLPLLDMTTRQAGGCLKILSRPGQGTRVEAVYKYSHLDRPPLGNMVDTLLTIIIGNAERGIIYRHQVNERQFVFNLDEIKANLGDIPVTHPSIVQWLREFLAAGIAELYGGGESENPGGFETLA